MAKANSKGSGKKAKKLTLADYRDQFVTVYPTAQNPYHEQSVSFQLHPKQAKLLEAKGFITTEEPDGWEEKVFDEEHSTPADEGELIA